MRLTHLLGVASVLSLAFLAGCAADSGSDGEAQGAADALASSVKVWVTSDPSDPFTHDTDAYNRDLAFGPVADGVETVVVDEVNNKRATVEGFGAALTDSAAGLLMGDGEAHPISRGERDALLDALMTPGKGIGLNILRVGIGATGGSTLGPGYTYDDNGRQPDPTLANFSLAHDEKNIIPILQDVLQHRNKATKIIASSWTAPAWMKRGSHSLVGGSLAPEYYGAYADYFVKFVRGYWDAGIPIYAVTPQNEPGVGAAYASMSLDAADEARFVSRHLAPSLAGAHFGWVRILGFDFNWAGPNDYPGKLLSEGAARNALSGIAFHCYGPDHSGALSDLHARFPHKDIFVTECDRTITDAGVTEGEEGIQRLIHSMNNWSRSYVAWAIALHSDGSPAASDHTACHKPGAHCVGVVSIDHGKVTKRWDYAYLGHASLFAQRGAQVVAVDKVGDVESTAFVNPSGARALVSYNAADHDETVQVKWIANGTPRAFTATIPKRSVATYAF